jgi:hypothetical protein
MFPLGWLAPTFALIGARWRLFKRLGSVSGLTCRGVVAVRENFPERGHMTPPTIARLRSMGVAAFRVACDQMARRHSAFVAFMTAGVDDSAEFPSIPRLFAWGP